MEGHKHKANSKVMNKIPTNTTATVFNCHNQNNASKFKLQYLLSSEFSKNIRFKKISHLSIIKYSANLVLVIPISHTTATMHLNLRIFSIFQKNAAMQMFKMIAILLECCMLNLFCILLWTTEPVQTQMQNWRAPPRTGANHLVPGLLDPI